MFIYQARKSNLDPGPSRVSYYSVSAETVIYEAFVVIGSLGLGFSVLLSWRKRRVQRSFGMGEYDAFCEDCGGNIKYFDIV